MFFINGIFTFYQTTIFVYQYLTMRQFVVLLFIAGCSFSALAQTPKSYTSSEILLQIKKLNVLGSVLYIAAHPDDENTRLLGYLANEKLYRTGYMSMTRGDGGQNLIGDEQGIDLGLIRTQELLSARRIDGAEQFFSRAYDFGFCKTAEEALATWGHDKILSDVVWVVRKFRPDVIIARFPEDTRAGHGHHAASGILAREAFDAAADPTKFPEQLQQGVTVWQAKRMLWNTFNFGGTSTQNESQFKVDVGMYNPLLGKSYGEIAALSRSQHKSQGFGVPAQRGSAIEYFETIKGDRPVNDLADGVDMSWGRVNYPDQKNSSVIKNKIDSIISNFKDEHPENSIEKLAELKLLIFPIIKIDSPFEINSNQWSNYIGIKLYEIEKLISICSGIFMDATVASQLNTIGDSIKINITINNRLGLDINKVLVTAFKKNVLFSDLPKNQNVTKTITAFIDKAEDPSQPYWLEWEKTNGAFTVHNQSLIGKPESYPYLASFVINMNSDNYGLDKPIQYKYTDPIKGELYQPLQVVNPFFINTNPAIVILKNDTKGQKKMINYSLQSNTNFKNRVKFNSMLDNKPISVFDSVVTLSKADKKQFQFIINGETIKNNSSQFVSGELVSESLYSHQFFSLKKISYDHIPDIYYNYRDITKVIKLDLKIAGKSIGYIPGAGDKVPQALEQMGYKVTTLKETDITLANVKQFDAIVTGVRAYNTNDWMNNVYDVLMQFVNNGGVLLVQYNTSNQNGPVKARIAPYPFNIGRTRVTDETAKVNFLLPNHPALNYPNKITDKDFDGWIQERSIYHAEKIDSSYQHILSMKDPGEKEEQDGSLIIANYGKGKFVYTGLVFFRELPAGVPGAYRLFANLLAPLHLPAGETLNNPLPARKNKLSSKKTVQ